MKSWHFQQRELCQKLGLSAFLNQLNVWTNTKTSSAHSVNILNFPWSKLLKIMQWCISQVKSSLCVPNISLRNQKVDKIFFIIDGFPFCSVSLTLS